MRADFRVVLDACVLANFRVCDVLLSLAESPRLFLPFWSEAILDETQRTQTNKLGWPEAIAESFRNEITSCFPEAMVAGFAHLLDQCSNDPKDRHVLACAIHQKAELILTFNLRDFPTASLSRWQIEAKHPEEYLLALYSMEPISVVHRLETIARDRAEDFEDYMLALGRSLPGFSQRILSDIQTSS